jgi:phenylpyruvate tautomerase PptA (4-oxalocrotonate tautomerase family)
MPLVRIALVKGKSLAYIRAIADGVHRALHDAYNVPTDDRFQLIDQYEPGAMIVDADYMGIHRTVDTVIIQIVASATRDGPTKANLYRAVTDNLVADPGLRPEDVMIVISGNGREDWSFGLGRQSYASK